MGPRPKGKRKGPRESPRGGKLYDSGSKAPDPVGLEGFLYRRDTLRVPRTPYFRLQLFFRSPPTYHFLNRGVNPSVRPLSPNRITSSSLITSHHHHHSFLKPTPELPSQTFTLKRTVYPIPPSSGF